jgi:hypothetical protein
MQKNKQKARKRMNERRKTKCQCSWFSYVLLALEVLDEGLDAERERNEAGLLPSSYSLMFSMYVSTATSSGSAAFVQASGIDLH